MAIKMEREIVGFKLFLSRIRCYIEWIVQLLMIYIWAMLLYGTKQNMSYDFQIRR